MKNFEVTFRNYNTVNGETRKDKIIANNSIEAKMDYMIENNVIVISVVEL